jgi:hypothetical protein
MTHHLSNRLYATTRSFCVRSIPVAAIVLTIALLLTIWPASAEAAAERERRGVVPVQQVAANNLLEPNGINQHGHVRLRINPNALAALHEHAPHGDQVGIASAISLRVPLTADEEVDLVMRPFRAITPGARFVQVVNGEEVEMRVPNVLLLRGEIAGQPGSRAFLAITERGGGTGSIQFTAGRAMQFDTDRDEHDNVLGLIVRPSGGELPPVDELCRVKHPDGRIAQPGDECCSAHGRPETLSGEQNLYRGPRLLTIAIEGDHYFTDLFPTVDDAAAYVVQVIGAVSDVFYRDLEFRLMIDNVRLWPDGDMPFSAQNLSGFRAWWLANNSMDGINLVHLFSGRRDTGYGGVAYIANACNQNGFAISAFLNGDFPDPVQMSHLGNWDPMVIAHEIGHNLGVWHTHDYGIDQCASGQNIRGTIMSYCHINQGGLLNTDLRMHREIAALILDANPHGPDDCLFYDCNGNGIDDAIDIASGTSEDIDGNGIPDECEDCTGTGVLHSVLIAQGEPDVNGNGIPDICEIDCTGTGVPDSWEIKQGWVDDLNGNNIPDECEPDCDGNGVPDFLDILDGTHTDYDRDGVPDVCQDCLGNGQPDWIDLERQFHLFIAIANSPIREYHRDSGVYMQSLGLGLGLVFDLTFGEDRLLYATSMGLNGVMRIDPDTGQQELFVQSGAGGLQEPASLTFGPNGNLFVLSRNQNAVYEYSADSGSFVSVFVTSGSGGLVDPTTIRFGPNGNLFITGNDNTVREYHGETGAFLGIFADGLSAMLSQPRGMTFLPNGDMLVVNNSSAMISRIAPNGVFLGPFNDEFPLNSPWFVAVGPNGTVFTNSQVSPVRIVEYEAETGKYLRSFVRGDTDLTLPRMLAFRPASPLDSNGSGIPDECEDDCAPADLNCDGVVNVADLLLLFDQWGECDDCDTCPADLNSDCIVNVADLLILFDNWG